MNIRSLFVLGAFLTISLGCQLSYAQQAPAQPQPFLGEIRMFAGNFPPRGWAFCEGQLLSVSHNTALFSILGTTYGGDGRTTFALPDLRGRVPVHPTRGASKFPLDGILRLGRKTETVDVVVAPNKEDANKPDKKITRTVPTLSINFIIAIQGTFPSRN